MSLLEISIFTLAFTTFIGALNLADYTQATTDLTAAVTAVVARLQELATAVKGGLDSNTVGDQLETFAGQLNAAVTASQQ